MSNVTKPPRETVRLRSLQLLAVYVAVGGVASAWRLATGSGSIGAVASYSVIGALATYGFLGRSRIAGLIEDWLPLVSLPVLYLAIPGTTPHAGGQTFDPVIQSLDAGFFGTQPSRSMAGAFPYAPLSELLHAAYVSYYVIIYVPPLLMYLSGAREAFQQSVLAFTLVMVICFLIFCAFPVAGPRFEWGQPAGVPNGPIRRATLWLLERGSARGTAFPSSHMAIALSMGLSSIRWRPRFGGLVLMLTGLLGWGAVYGGFHYALDMLAGGLAGSLGWWLASVLAGSTQGAAVALNPCEAEGYERRRRD